MNRIKNIKLLFCLSLINLIRFPALFRVKSLLLKSIGIKVGKNVKVAGKVYLTSSNIIIGDNVWLGDDIRIYCTDSGSVELGSNIDIGPNVTICTGTHEIGNANRRAGKGYTEGIIIEDGCWIGIGSLILNGSHIGKGSIISARSTIKGNIDVNTLVKREKPTKVKIREVN